MSKAQVTQGRLKTVKIAKLRFLAFQANTFLALQETSFLASQATLFIVLQASNLLSFRSFFKIIELQLLVLQVTR